MLIPVHQLNPDTLRRIVEEYVSREGTDYGLHSSDLATKVEQVLRQLKNKEALLCYDELSESCQILSKDTWRSVQNPASPPTTWRE
ncbi:MAG: YheU family protein [Proteobacteria bacterium]|nr:YheU family protein [Pseudomonadota bacterium]